MNDETTRGSRTLPTGERSLSLRREGRAPVKIDILRRMIRTGAHGRAQKLIERVHSADIAELFPNLSPGEQRTLIDLLYNTARAGKTLRELPEEILPEVLALIDDAKLAAIVARVEPDDGAYFIEGLPEDRRPSVLTLLDTKKRHEVERVLGSPEESAGSFMTTRIATVLDDITCEAALERLRTLGDQVEDVFYVYATNADGMLTGVVPMRRLLLSPPGTLIRDAMIPDPVSVHEDADQEEAAELVAKYNLLAIPVVDGEGKILGAITVDDVIDVIQEEATEDMYRMVGLGEEDRVFSPLSLSLRKRLPWMILNLATAFLAASVVGVFQDAIREAVALAVFMPVVAGMGGNVGTQTLTVVTRAIAIGELELTSVAKAVVKQVTIGIGIGGVTGLLTALAGYFWAGKPIFGLILFLAMAINMAMAGLAGAAVPLVLRRFRQDPAMGSGVIVTTFTDVCGFFTFLALASAFIEQLR
ncbi:MAG: magnesium transporter [Bdellovibrionota bacterium]